VYSSRNPSLVGAGSVVAGSSACRYALTQSMLGALEANAR
jgi:hypothetical protein